MKINTLKKIDIAKNLSLKIGFPVSFSKKLIDDLIDIYKNQIKNEKLILKDIGSFKIINKNSRIGRNPKTKEEFKIDKRKSISFSVSKNLAKILNN